MSRLPRPKVFNWAYAYGDAHDPWPGDLAMGFPLLVALRFDGQVWRSLRAPRRGR